MFPATFPENRQECVRIGINGHTFNTDRRILLEYPNSFFGGVARQETVRIELDVDAWIFQQVLVAMETGDVEGASRGLKSDALLGGFIDQLDYFLLSEYFDDNILRELVQRNDTIIERELMPKQREAEGMAFFLGRYNGLRLWKIPAYRTNGGHYLLSIVDRSVDKRFMKSQLANLHLRLSRQNRLLLPQLDVYTRTLLVGRPEDLILGAGVVLIDPLAFLLSWDGDDTPNQPIGTLSKQTIGQLSLDLSHREQIVELMQYVYPDLLFSILRWSLTAHAEVYQTGEDIVLSGSTHKHFEKYVDIFRRETGLVITHTTIKEPKSWPRSVYLSDTHMVNESRHHPELIDWISRSHLQSMLGATTDITNLVELFRVFIQERSVFTKTTPDDSNGSSGYKK
jgi:hypothetical protein